MAQDMSYQDMTEEEAQRLSDYYTKNPPETDPSQKDGVFMKRKMNRFSGMDNLTVNYLLTKSIETHKTPEEIIGDLVREKIAAAV